MGPVSALLRPSSVHILIVRAPGARGRHGCHSIPFYRKAFASTKNRLAHFFSLLTFHWRRGLGCPQLCASNEGLQRPRVARAQGIFWPSFFLSFFLLLLLLGIGGVARWSLTERVERGPSEAARSASKKGCRAAPSALASHSSPPVQCPRNPLAF